MVKKCLSIIIYLCLYSLSFGQGAYLSNDDIGDLTDTIIYEVNVGDNFTTGDTISSSSMNTKFSILKDMLEKILNHNNINVPNGLSYISTTGEKKIIIFSTSYTKNTRSGRNG